VAARFEIRKRRGGPFYFVVVGGNNQTVATSENYTTKARCQRGIDAVRRMAGEAPVRDLAEAQPGRRRAAAPGSARAHPGKEPTATPASPRLQSTRP
jgi:uncharacterized protein